MAGMTETGSVTPRRGLTFYNPPDADVPARTPRNTRRQFQDASDGDDDESDEADDEDDVEPGNKTPSSAALRKSLKRNAIDVLAPNAGKQKKKRSRIVGGAAPTAKRIVPDYDSEDNIIVTMKQAGYSDNDVVKRLCDEGRTKYDPKSISSRWQRIRKCLQANEDELFDEELTDWHEGEDELLEEAYKRAELRLDEEINKINNKFFTYVAHEINKDAPRPRFSARACKDRYEARKAGTARIPPELDPDPEGRARERLERIQAYKLRKEQEAQQVRDEAEQRKKDKNQADEKKNVARQKREAETAIRNRRKKEEDDFKQAKIDAAKEKRRQRKDAMDYLRAFRLYQQRKHHAEKMLYKKLQKEANKRERALARFSLQFPLPTEAIGFGNNTPAAQPNKRASSRTVRDEALGTMDFAAQELSLDIRNERLAATPAKGKIASGNTPSSRRGRNALDPSGGQNIFGADPRSMLTMAELYDLMRDRGMLLGRMKEVKGVVLSRLADEDNSMDRESLQALLRERNLNPQGPNRILIRRLQEDDAKNSAAYKRRFADKLPAAELAMKNAAAAIANGGRRRGPRSPKTPTAGRFTAKTKSAAPASQYNVKRYSARERTLRLQEAGMVTEAASASRERVAWLEKAAQEGAQAKIKAKTKAKATAKIPRSTGVRTRAMAIAKTPMHSAMPEPTYAPMRMREEINESGDNPDGDIEEGAHTPEQDYDEEVRGERDDDYQAEGDAEVADDGDADDNWQDS